MSSENAHHPANHGHYEVELGDENLSFRTVKLDDPVVLGRQLIGATGIRLVEEHIALALLPDGRLEEISLDEPFDLRGHGVEKVVILKADSTYRFFVDGREMVWKTVVSGSVLKKLAGVPATHDLYLEVRRGDDILIRNTDLVDLRKEGVERFFSAIAQTTEGLSALLPPRDVAYLTSREIGHEDYLEGGHRGVVLKEFPLPVGKFNAATADILILLPPGYPDAPVDMFYAMPWLIGAP